MEKKKDIRLLCSFTNKKNLDNLINKILEVCQLVKNEVFLFKDLNRPNSFFVTYDVYNNGNNCKEIPKTIIIHRKIETNTLYTINALNALLKKNQRQNDKFQDINWENYKNCLVIANKDNELEVIKTKLLRIYKFQKYPEKVEA